MSSPPPGFVPPPDPQGPFLPTSLSVAALTIAVLFGVTAFVTVGFRLWAQRRTKAGITLDAYLIVIALVITSAMCILTSYMATHAALGWPAAYVLTPAGDRFLKALDAHQMMWGVAIACIRASLLCFYKRIFTTHKFQMAVYAVLVFNGLSLIVFIIVTALTFNLSGLVQTVINYSAWLISYGCIDIVQDLTVLCLPLFVIRKLNMSTRQKVGVTALFWLGIFCVIASIARVVYFVQLGQAAGDLQDYFNKTALCTIWSTIEPCTSIIAACLPTLAPLFRGEFDLHTRFFSKFTSLLRSTRQSSSRNTETQKTDQGIKVGSSQNTWDRLHSKNSSQVEIVTVDEAYKMHQMK